MRIPRSLGPLAVISVSLHIASTPGFAQGIARGNPAIACFAQKLSGKALVGLDLVVMDATGANRTVIGSVPELHSYRLSWSPDLDAAAPGYEGEIVYSTANRLYTVNVSIPGDGTFSWTARQQVPVIVPSGNTSFSSYDPVWSPAGDSIAISGLANNGSVTTLGGVWTLPPTGGLPTWVAHGEYPAWDPTGQWLCYKYYSDLLAVQVGMNSSPLTLVTNLVYPNSTTTTWPSWSGACIAFTGDIVAKSSYQPALFVLNPATAATPVSLSQLNPVPGPVALASWAPDSKNLVASTAKGVVRIDPVTGAQTLLSASTSSYNLIQVDSRR